MSPAVEVSIAYYESKCCCADFLTGNLALEKPVKVGKEMSRQRIVVLSGRESAGLSIKRQLAGLFGDIFDIDSYSLEKGINTYILADLVLSTSYQVTSSFVKYLTPGTNMYVVRCTLTRNGWEKVMQIPPRTVVYVMNDADEAAMTSAMLYELGARHLEFVTYNREAAVTPDIKVAITPNEGDFVPLTVSKVVHVGERVLDSYTLFDVLGKLGQLNKKTSQIIINHMDEIVPRSPGFLSMFDNLAGSKHCLELLMDIVHEGFVVFNAENNIITFNKQAEKLFNMSSWEVIGCNVKRVLSRWDLQHLLQARELYDEVVNINGILHIVNKYQLQDKTENFVGVITFKECTEIQRLELKFRKNLRKKGHVSKYDFADIKGKSVKLQNTIQLAERMARGDCGILIQGESGTGKELFAQAIHNASGRKGDPFVAFNCAAVADTLIESELFGYEEGAFTGAKKGGKPGLFELAHTGTLFLDEIGDISRNMQGSLLRVLQEKEIVRVGGTDVIPVDVRIIAATNRDLGKLVEKGEFRADLYYRLNVMCLFLPPLRERKEDIPCLVEYMLEKRRVKKDIPHEVMDALQAYNWPGNARELDNCVEYMANIATKNSFCLQDLPPDMLMAGGSALPPGELAQLGNEQELLVILHALKEKRRAGSGRRSLAQIVAEQGFDLTEHEIRGKLKRLAAAQLVIVNTGRAGTKLSPQGEKLLYKLN